VIISYVLQSTLNKFIPCILLPFLGDRGTQEMNFMNFYFHMHISLKFAPFYLIKIPLLKSNSYPVLMSLPEVVTPGHKHQRMKAK
jgi:hypothetical protein